MNNILDLIITAILSMLITSVQVGNVTGEKAVVIAANDASVLSNYGGKIAVACTKSLGACTANDGTAIAAGSIPTTFSGYWTNPPTEPLDKKPYALNVIPDPSDSSKLYYTIDDPQSFTGTEVQNMAARDNSGNPTSVTLSATYYLHYDGCTNSVYISTGATSTPTVCS